MVLRNTRLDSIHLRLRPVEAHAGFKPGNHRMPVRRPALVNAYAHPTGRQPQLAVAGKPKAGRHHTHDGINSAAVRIDGNDAPDDVGIRAEAALPKVVADHGNAVTLPLIFRGKKSA